MVIRIEKKYRGPITSKSLDQVLAVLLFFVLFFTSNGCDQQSLGFALPPGDVTDGRAIFEEMACNQCHSVADIDWLGVEGEDFNLKLGGEVIKVKTYGELVTSVINPSHRISRLFKGEMPSRDAQSPMPSYNQIMTVQELTDLITFLEKQYDLKPPPGYYYTW